MNSNRIEIELVQLRISPSIFSESLEKEDLDHATRVINAALLANYPRLNQSYNFLRWYLDGSKEKIIVFLATSAEEMSQVDTMRIGRE